MTIFTVPHVLMLARPGVDLRLAVAVVQIPMSPRPWGVGHRDGEWGGGRSWTTRQKRKSVLLKS